MTTLAATIHCRYCSGKHAHVEEVKLCWAAAQTKRKAAKVHGFDCDCEACEAERAQEDRRMALREVDRTGTRYRSAEAQRTQTLDLTVSKLQRQGLRVDQWGPNQRVAEAFDNLVEAVSTDQFEDDETYSVEGVEHLTDGRHWLAHWTIADERIRTPGHSAFALRENQQVPEVSRYDTDWRPDLIQGQKLWDSNWHGTGPWNRQLRTHIEPMAGPDLTVRLHRERIQLQGSAPEKPRGSTRPDLFGVRKARQMLALVESDRAWWARHGGRS